VNEEKQAVGSPSYAKAIEGGNLNSRKLSQRQAGGGGLTGLHRLIQVS